MLPAIMAGVGLVSSFMGKKDGGGGGGGMSLPSLPGLPSFGSADTVSAGPSNAIGGIGPNTQSSPFVIASGGSSVRDSGSVLNRFTQDISPTIDQTATTTGARVNPNTAPTVGGNYPSNQYYDQQDNGQSNGQQNPNGFQIGSIPQSYWIVGGAVLLVLILAIAVSKSKKSKK